jgi:hypothetical protein
VRAEVESDVKEDDDVETMVLVAGVEVVDLGTAEDVGVVGAL